MFRGGQTAGGNAQGNNVPATPPAAAGGGGSAAAAGASAAATPTSPASSAASTMLNFARALGMSKGPAGGSAPAAPVPADLPNPTTPPGAADTSSVFYIDDSLSELQRVKRYSLSQLPLQRLVYVKRIAACARTVGLRDSLTQLLPLFAKLGSDQEAVVRSAAANELANLAHFLADPTVPYQPLAHTSTASMVSALASKPPSTAQSPDLTLEDDQLVDFPVTDVSNDLPPSMPSAASQAAAAAAPADPLGVLMPPAAHSAAVADPSAIAAAAATVVPTAAAANPDAMDVDSVAPPPIGVVGLKPTQPQPAEADSDVPMDVSDVPADEVQQDGSSASADAASAPAASVPEDKQQQQQPAADNATTAVATEAASAATPAATPSSPPLSASAVPPLSVAGSNSPSSSAAASASSASVAASPLSDPTSSLRLESYEHIKDTVIPCLQNLILDGNAEVRAAACDALVRVADVLRGDDVGKVVLTLVLNLAHDERDEQRTTAVHLMHELAPRLGHDLCRSFVALELAAFADDSTFRVRKATAQSFGNVSEMVGAAFTESKLLPCYVRLSKDLIWGVRRGAIESLVAVTRVVSAQTRAEVIIPMFERFAKDSSRWVRNGAYEVLGPFLHALGPSLASRELVAYFSNIPSMSSAVVDAEVNYHAAFNLPAVLQTIGSQRWDELAPCFAALVKDTKFPVRRTLAYSLHEMATILGPALTESSLLPALDTFLRDLDEVRYGVLKSFALLLRAITPAKRVAYLEVIWMVQKQRENWRWRLLWSKQLGAFAKLFDAEHTVTDIMPLAFALCKDEVAAVRRTAAIAVSHNHAWTLQELGRLLSRVLSFATPNPVVSPCLYDMHAFATSATYMDRQLYLRVVEGVVGEVAPEMLEQFLQRALPLCSDRTSNVRLACAHTLRSIMSHPHCQQSATVREMVRVLSADSHGEVRRCMLDAQTAHATSAITQHMASLAIHGAEGDATSVEGANSSSAPSSTELTDADLADMLAGPNGTAPAASASASSAAAASHAADSAQTADSSAAADASASSHDQSSAPSDAADTADAAAAGEQTDSSAAAPSDSASPDEVQVALGNE